MDHLRQAEQLNHLAYDDALTGHANGMLFNARVTQFLDTASDAGMRLAIGVVDIERFKSINDVWGRHAGDAVLRQVAARLLATVGERSRLARVGPDQYGVVIQNAPQGIELLRTLDRRRWIERGLAAPNVAVNVSAVQLRRSDFVDTVLAVLGDAAGEAGIDLEITESAAMEDVDDTIVKLRRLRAHGIVLAIDDFGTGYSSLAYLSKLPAQVLKIDRAFIVTMNTDHNAMTLVSTMVSLAHAMHMEVVAEGVETQEQADTLGALRCDQLQGYLVSRPLPEPAFALLLDAGPCPSPTTS